MPAILRGESELLDSKPFVPNKLCGAVAWLPGKVPEPIGEVEGPIADDEPPLDDVDEPLGDAAWPGEAVVPGGEGV